MDDIGAVLQDNDWRQGVIIPASEVAEHLPANITHEDCSLVVVSQSCDIIHHSLENEPHAVFLVLRPETEAQLGFRCGKHPRLIHLTSDTGEVYSAQACQQVFIPREALASVSLTGSDKILGEELRILCDWLAKRYTRIAFPDSFNNQVASRQDKIQKLIKKNHEVFSEILLSLSPFDEISEEESYQLICRLVMPEKTHEDEASFRKAEAFAEKLRELFKECAIEVEDIAPISEQDLSYADLKQLARWDYDYLSNRDAT